MFRITTLIPLIFLLAALPAQACRCLWEGNFTELDLEEHTIVLGEVQSHAGNSMDLSVMEVLSGKLFQEQIRVWGAIGNLCRADVKEFEKGSQWLMVLDSIEETPEWGFNPSTPNFSYGRVGDFELSRCGVYWLKHHNGYLSGNVDDARRWFYLDRKKSPVSLELIKAFIDGRADKELLAEAAAPREGKEALQLNTRVFLEQQMREQHLREKLESLEETH
ncbi:hypothetical protein FHR99_002429 [Litorivivens lipolytica]|uniref:Delta-aminolevulinic acid dehydratase n=1 Tax=Litorivivens lipolytica TaxID=1524264 RepID=A0A7W4W6W6_9GAMM|nr:hypothetical protein [Litorivivens lipolytica]MBB3048163.1 hypothetical protein [Litorivivens lipolytica]